MQIQRGLVREYIYTKKVLVRLYIYRELYLENIYKQRGLPKEYIYIGRIRLYIISHEKKIKTSKSP